MAINQFEILCNHCALCCKTIIIGLAGQTSDDVEYWASVGTPFGTASVVQMRCRQLGPDNRCGIYDLRPTKCRCFQPGGKACNLLRKADGREEVKA